MIDKVKTVYHVTLEEAKRQIGLDQDFTRDDAYISSLIKAAYSIAESRIQKDIAKTTNVLTRYDFAGGTIRVNEGNLISITTIEIQESETPLSDFVTYVYRDRFRVELDSDIDTAELTVTFETGYDEGKIPEDLKQAILIRIAGLYDYDRAPSVLASVRDTGLFERLTEPYVASHVDYEREN